MFSGIPVSEEETNCRPLSAVSTLVPGGSGTGCVASASEASFMLQKCKGFSQVESQEF